MTESLPCSADSGVTRDAEGRTVAVPCARPAEYVVTYRGVERRLCTGHRATLCRSRPEAEVRRLSLADAARALGFESEAELHGLVCSRDIANPEGLAAFQRWKTEDGTKAGLLKLPARGDT